MPEQWHTAKPGKMSLQRSWKRLRNKLSASLTVRAFLCRVKEYQRATLFARQPEALKPVIVVRFVNGKHKTEMLQQAKRLKGADIYINEHLTKKNADIARHARILRKEKKIQATWTRNGKVLIRLNGISEEAKVVVIRELKDLDQYK